MHFVGTIRGQRRIAGLTSTLLGVALLVAACGSSSSSSATTPATTPAGGSTTAGQVTTGKPITIQFPNLQGSTQGVNLPEDSAGAQAAVKWINHHGGVDGRPLQLSVCDLLTTPASDVACSNSMAAANPVAILAGAVDNATPIVTAAANAGIPYTAAVCNAPLELTSPDSHCFLPGNTGSYDLVANNEQKEGGKNVSLVLIAAPGAVAEVHAAANPSFAAHGVNVKVVLTSPTGQADITPIIQSAVQAPASGVFLDEDPTTCIAGLNGKATLGVSSSIRFYEDLSCESPVVVKGAGKNADGTLFTQIGDLSNTSDPDYAVYNSALNQYASGVSHVGEVSDGFLGVMDLYRVMLTMGSTPVTQTNLKAALNNAKNVKAFLGDGATFTCDHTTFKSSPSVCGNTDYLETYTSSGGFQYLRSATIPAGS